jgi:hypothetical protein
VSGAIIRRRHCASKAIRIIVLSFKIVETLRFCLKMEFAILSDYGSRFFGSPTASQADGG